MKKGKKEIYQANRDEIIVKNYYSKEINKGMSYRAVNIDKVFFVIILFLASLAFFANITKTLILPIYLSLALVYFTTRALVKFRIKKRNAKIHKVKEDLKSRKLMREISQMNREEFIVYVKGILERYYQSEFFYGKDDIDLETTINGRRYAVKCVKSSQEDKVIKKKVNDFYNYINYLGYQEGIMISSSNFQDGSADENSLILLDFIKLKEILKEIDEYPTDEVIDGFIIDRYKHRKDNMKNRLKSISTWKIVRLYIMFIVFYLISFFTSLSMYYKVIGIICFVTATIMGALKITDHIKTKGKGALHK
ncbi:hypothetical protein E9840_09785 [Tissierella creatinini]|nr:hypothetical protein E9840_09785 [Tissierella creatinini]TJX64444.1 hypothetical protein E8P77_12375 [Soehngenia saccharolytica]